MQRFYGDLVKLQITKILFFFLLAVRFTGEFFVDKMFDSQIPDWFKYLYFLIIYSSIVFLIWFNRDRLQNMNIDRGFITLVLFAGTFLFLFYLPPTIGVIILFLMAFMIWCLVNAKLNLAIFNAEPRSLFVYVLMSLIPVSLLFLYDVFFARIEIEISEQLMLSIAINRDILGIVFEEILFRGVLWMLLIDLKLSPRTVVIIQALFFWTAHYQLLFKGSYYTFWVTLPIISLTYGIIVNKSKSISVTSLCHWINNFATALMNSYL